MQNGIHGLKSKQFAYLFLSTPFLQQHFTMETSKDHFKMAISMLAKQSHFGYYLEGCYVIWMHLN